MSRKHNPFEPILDEVELKKHNVMLKTLFPKIPGRNEPLFRIVWADERLRENRFGEFNEYSEDGNIFLRRTIGTANVPKYSYFDNKYVLERWNPGKHPDVKSDEQGGYEPFYVYQDKHNRFLPLNWKVTQSLVQTYINGVDRQPTKTSQESFDEEVKYFESQIEAPSILSHDGGISYAGSYKDQPETPVDNVNLDSTVPDH